MSDEIVNNAPITPNTPKEPTNTVPGELSQAELEQMSGAELAKYFAEQKAKEQDQPRGANGKFAPKETTSLIKEAAQEAKRKLKIDNEEIDEEEVFKVYKARKEHQRAANKELHEGKNARKQAEEFISMMKDKNKLFDVITKLGHDPRQLTEEYLASQLQDEMMDPREKELRDARNKLKSFEDMERKQKEEVARAHHEQMKAKYAEDYNKQFVAALSETGLPPTKPMVAEMAKYIARSAKMGYEMTPLEASQLVLEDVQASHRRLIGDSDGDILMKLLGDDVANKIRKYDIGKIKTPQQVLKNVSKDEQPDEYHEREKSGNKRMTAKEWREFNRKGNK